MTYAEILNNQEGMGQHSEKMPFGSFCRKQIDRKYRNVLELKPVLTDSLVFCEGLRRDQEQTAAIAHRGQLHYVVCSEEGRVRSLEIEQGSFLSLSQLFDSNPAIVAASGYVDTTVNALFDITMKLHERHIYHLCFAPQNVFVRKGDNAPLLLCHGSSFMALASQAELYE
jgi:hypothetical protein